MIVFLHKITKTQWKNSID